MLCWQENPYIIAISTEIYFSLSSIMLLINFDTQLASEWHIIFYIAAIIYLLGGMIYALCASGERQKWAEMPMGYLPYDDFTEPNQH